MLDDGNERIGRCVMNLPTWSSLGVRAVKGCSFARGAGRIQAKLLEVLLRAAMDAQAFIANTAAALIRFMSFLEENVRLLFTYKAFSC